MDRYAFLLELNTGLNMKISDNEINGDMNERGVLTVP